MKPMIGVRFAGPDKLIHLVEAGEVVQRLGRSVAERRHRPAQIREGFSNGNQLAALTLHGSLSHDGRTPPGYWRKSIVCLYSTRTDMRIESTYIWQGDRATVIGDQ